MAGKESRRGKVANSRRSERKKRERNQSLGRRHSALTKKINLLNEELKMEVGQDNDPEIILAIQKKINEATVKRDKVARLEDRKNGPQTHHGSIFCSKKRETMNSMKVWRSKWNKAMDGSEDHLPTEQTALRGFQPRDQQDLRDRTAANQCKLDKASASIKQQQGYELA